MNKLIIAFLASAIMLTGCVTKNEIIVGKDADGNEIVREVNRINYPKAAVDRVNLALRYIELKEMTEAKINLEKAESYDPNTEILLLAWGYYYAVVEADKKADEYYQRAISKYPNSGTVYSNYGVFLCSRGHYEEADKMFVKAIEMPKYANMSYTYERAATCSYEAGDKAKSQKYFEQAMNYGGTSPSLLFNYASFSLEQGDAKKADKLMRTFDMFEKNNTPQSYMLKIKIASALGQYATAEILGRKLLKSFPDSEEAANYLKGNY